MSYTAKSLVGQAKKELPKEKKIDSAGTQTSLSQLRFRNIGEFEVMWENTLRRETLAQGKTLDKKNQRTEISRDFPLDSIEGPPHLVLTHPERKTYRLIGTTSD